MLLKVNQQKRISGFLLIKLELFKNITTHFAKIWQNVCKDDILCLKKIPQNLIKR